MATRTSKEAKGSKKAPGSKKAMAANGRAEEGTEWTVMVYMSSDNDLGSECVWALTEIQSTNLTAQEQVAVIAQFDSPARGFGTQRFDFSGIGPRRPAVAPPEARLEDFRVGNFADAVEERHIFFAPKNRKKFPVVEENFADPEVLSEFVEKGIERYPAKHYLVILSGYGNGAIGGLLTEENPVSAMSIEQLKKALKKVQEDHQPFLRHDPKGEIDILGLDSCLMSMVEVASELSGTVRYLVASEGLTPTTGWPYRRILETLRDKPAMAPEAVARSIVDNHINYYSDYIISGVSVDLSVCDLSKIAGVKTAVKELVEVLTTKNGQRLKLSPNTTDAVILAHWKAQSYRFDQHVDLWDFCDCLAESSSLDTVQTACANVKRAIGRCVMNPKFSGAAFQHSHGLSIYFPWASSELPTIQQYAQLEFADDTDWGKFLEAYVLASEKEIRGGFKPTQKALIFPQDGFGENRETPGQGSAKETPGQGSAKETPGQGSAKETPGQGSAKENPGQGSAKDLLMGGGMSGVVVFMPKVKNPASHFYKYVPATNGAVKKKANKAAKTNGAAKIKAAKKS